MHVQGAPSTPPAHDAAPTVPASTPPPGTGLPFSLVLGTLAGLMILATSLTTLRDIDLYWHILAGRQLLEGTSPSGIGLAWSFAPDPLPWTTTQWLSEVLFAWLYDLFGWRGLAAFRVVTAATAIAALAAATLVARPKALAGFPFLTAAVLIAVVSQERPQQFTLIGAAVMGGVLVTGLADGAMPRWWVLLPGTILWANLHGGWVLVPATLGLVAVGTLADRGPSAPAARRAMGLALAAAVAGCLTPSGVSGLTAPLRFSRSAELIREWGAVEPTSTLGWLSIAMLAYFLVGWSASRSLPRSEALAVLALLTFSWLAWRNLAPGMALIAPLAARRLQVGFPKIGRPEPRWSAPAGLVMATLLTAAGLVVALTRDNVPSDTQPLSLAREIAGLPDGQRVLNHYNVSGAVLFFGGAGTQVAIDGRSDRYGGDYVSDYVDLFDLKGEWEELLDTLAPTSSLLPEDSALAHVLVAESGWTQVGRTDNGFVLLVAPEGTA